MSYNPEAICYHARMLLSNKKIHFNYEIIETFQAGIELLGFEVKSLREKQGSLEGAYILVRGGEAYMVGSFIPPYQASNTPTDYDPYRNRKLLLTKEELEKLSNTEQTKGLTIAPISVYNKGRNLKVEIALVRGKKKFDKRETIKQRESSRDIQRSLKRDS